MRHSSFVRSCVVIIGLCAVSQLALADQCSAIAPIQSHPHGKTYGEWATLWWKWAIETPASINAVIDPTGARCAVNQRKDVWFLASNFNGGTISRSCSVPKGTALFFPIVNDFYGAFTTDPAEQRTEAFLRSQVKCIEGAGVTASIDGHVVANASRYLEKSALFSAVLPTDNVFGVTTADIPQLTLSPAVDEGYYLFIEPLPPGQHQIRFSAAVGSSSCALPSDVTYNLTVAR
jgi:hypothetical protein